MWVLGTEPVSSGRAGSTPNWWAICPTPEVPFSKLTLACCQVCIKLASIPGFGGSNSHHQAKGKCFYRLSHLGHSGGDMKKKKKEKEKPTYPMTDQLKDAPKYNLVDQWVLLGLPTEIRVRSYLQEQKWLKDGGHGLWWSLTLQLSWSESVVCCF